MLRSESDYSYINFSVLKMLKIGLAGVGYLGSRHLQHLLKMDGVSVSGVWDSDPAVRARISSEYGIQSCDSFEELIRISDAVDVVTPTSTHYDLGMQVVAASKPVFIEKPICATFNDGDKLVSAAERKAIPVQVGHIERFNRAFRSLKEVSLKPQFIEAHRLAQWVGRGVDVAVVYDLMIHDLDLVLTLAETEPIHIHANGVGVVTNSVDIATARIEFADGLVANITASRISLKKMRKIRVFGKHEYVALDFNKGTCEYVGAAPVKADLPDGSIPLTQLGEGERALKLYQRFLDDGEGDAMRMELEAFRDLCLYGGRPVVDGNDGLKALKLAEQIVNTIGHNGHS